MRETTEPVTLSTGGITGEIEVFTGDGPVPVAELEAGASVYALDPTSGVAKLKPVTAVTEFEYEGEIVELDARRVDLRLHPEHRFPYRTRAFDVVRFQRAGDLQEREKYRFINDWQTPNKTDPDTIDVTAFLDEYQACVTYDCHGNSFRAALPTSCEPLGLSHRVGYIFDADTFDRFQDQIESLAETVAIRGKKGHEPRPYRFDTDDFVRFVGWYVTEGSIARKSNSDSVEIRISQYDQDHRDRIESLFDRLNIDATAATNGYYFGSWVYGELLDSECGSTAREKQLPEFVWALSDSQQQVLLEVLIDGDGDETGQFTTASPSLKDDVLRLCLEIGIKPRYYRRRDTCWTLFTGRVNDRLSSSEQVSERSFEGSMYRLAVADYNLVMAGRNGTFQWIGVSQVS